MVAQLTAQSFIDAITLPGVKVLGDGNTNGDWMNPRYAEPTVGSYPARINPGTVEIHDSGGLYAAGFGPWIEVSSLVENPGDAKVDVTGVLYSLSKATKQWTAQVQWGGARGFAAHAFSWGGEFGTFKEGVGPVGWGSVDTQGHHFMDKSTTWLGSNDRIRAHCWGMTWTGPNGLFWTSVNPNSATGAADRAKCNDILALVATLDVTVVGAQAAAARFAISSGWDLIPETASVTNPPLRPGSGSGFREVKNGSCIVTSTMDRAQIAAYAPALIALRGGAAPPPVTPPPVTPPPAGDVKHVHRLRYDIDGVSQLDQTYTA